MDFSHGSVSGLTPELGDHRHRMPGLSPGGGIGILSVGDPYKQCRPASEMDLDERTRGPLKIARTDSFPCSGRQQNNSNSNNNNNGGGSNNHNAIGSLLRSNSIISDSRLANCSPTNSSASDGGLMSNEGCVNVSEHRLMRSDSVVSAYGGGARTLSFHQPYYKSAGLPLSMTRSESANHMGIHGIVMGSRPPFTQSQWQELEHQALIFKYMMAGVPVPPDLLVPIRKSVAALSAALSAGSYHPNIPWSSFHLGYANNADPEPGRCRRTDGKKWRCSRDVVPDQKYCERHMHRGRHRSRKPVEGQTAASNSHSLGGPTSATTTSPTATTTASISNNSCGTSNSVSLAAARNANLHNSNLGPSAMAISNHHHQQQQHNNHAGSASNPLGINSSLLLQIASGSTSQMASAKEYRYMPNGMKEGDVDEQVYFSEVSGSTRSLGQDSCMPPSVNNNNNGWRSNNVASSTKASDEMKAQQNGSLMNYNSPQLRSLLAQDFGLMSEANHHMNLHQQHSFRNTGFGGVEGSVNAVARHDSDQGVQGQPLRHFFDDWPRSRDASALSWSDMEEDRSNRSSSTTQLSISIPMTSSDFSATNSSSPPGKLSLSPLKLSILSRDQEHHEQLKRGHDHHHGHGDVEEDEDDDDPLIGTQMGLGVGMNIINEEERHRQANWIPITWESPVGGPLAEVLQSTSECKNSSGLQSNLMTDSHGWECSSSQNNHSTNIAAAASSPTGVLQKTFVSLSDSTSSGSSPRAAPLKAESGILLT